MPNMANNKVEMPHLDADERIKNFDEVATGYTEEHAKEEAARCLGCPTAPCEKGCPVGVKIPAFIKMIEVGDYAGARAKIEETNLLGSICGRVCPQEVQCEKLCVRGIKGEPVAIGRLERFASDFESEKKKQEIESIDMKVAVVGSGPAGLACAGELAMHGVKVTIFEALHEVGGVLVYGIPEFRLPKKLVKSQIDGLRDLGVKIETNVVVGKTIDIDELREEFDAVFIGSGAGLPNFMKIEGEGLNGVYSSNEYLTRINLMKAWDDGDTPVKKGERVIVVGGGNVAMDAARCARRMGSDVVIAYRRTKAEMPARAEEIVHAIEEGIEIMELVSPLKILGEGGNVTGMEVIHTELAGEDESGRKSFRPIEGSNEVIPADVIVVAIGQRPNPLIPQSCGELEVNKWGGIIVRDESGETSIDGVYAGGDAVTGAATVILAMGAGRDAARAIMGANL